MNYTNECSREGSPEEEMFKLSWTAVSQVSVRRRGCARQRERHVHRSNGESDRRHSETERTVRAGLKSGRREMGEMPPGRGSSCTALR